MPLCIFLAPMYKVTDFHFRKAYVHTFGHIIDAAISPFISTHSGSITTGNPLFEDISINKNKELIPITPQLLGKDKKQLLDFCKAIQDLGYAHVNWNLGCPMPGIVKKQRGSGLLPFPDLIKEVLDTLFSSTHLQISIKTRLGFSSKKEIFDLLPIFNQYPMEYMVLHPRLGVEQYEGPVDNACFLQIQNACHIPVIYNGDIKSKADLETLRHIGISSRNIMIGRGILSNPFLPFELKGFPKTDKSQWETFHQTLIATFTEDNFPPLGILRRMKGSWKHWNAYLNLPADLFVSIMQSQTLQSYFTYTHQAFHWIKQYKQTT